MHCVIGGEVPLAKGRGPDENGAIKDHSKRVVLVNTIEIEFTNSQA